MYSRRLLFCVPGVIAIAAVLMVRTASGSHGHEAEAPTEEAAAEEEAGKAIRAFC